MTYDMRIGGTEQVIRNLIEGSNPQSTQMAIFCIEESLGPWGKELQSNNVAVYSCQRRPGFDWNLLRALRRCLRDTQADIVHCHQYTPWAYGALAAMGLSTKVVFTEHGRFYPDSASPKRRFINPLLAHLTHGITAISEATRQALVNYEYLAPDRISVIYNGIKGLTPDPKAAARLRTELGIPSGAPVMGSIARFDSIKNHPMLLRAFRQVLENHPEARLLLVGDGEERPVIEALIKELAISEHVILPGYLPEPSTWLEAMDVFLLSSFSEGTSMTLLEAMSLGKPCVVTDVGGNPEIVIDGETGSVTPSDDSDAFAHAIDQLINSPANLESMCAHSRERFHAHFSREMMQAAYSGIYKAL